MVAYKLGAPPKGADAATALEVANSLTLELPAYHSFSNAAKLAANIDVNGALTVTDVGQTCEKMMHSIARIRRAHPAPVKE